MFYDKAHLQGSSRPQHRQSCHKPCTCQVPVNAIVVGLDFWVRTWLQDLGFGDGTEELLGKKKKMQLEVSDKMRVDDRNNPSALVFIKEGLIMARVLMAHT
ncbi:hypothetical protein F3Y22_tig00110621pilonHSYRG00499 [Hibiscus syriacus]|uniref:Uncharacterized protein n=1 Tax=Hibiscus syriacus TaxID=106335 RepID=A0A6A2ZZW0_HIBSY|nr:hypothetical protein F3Y22_tig00110621pilonHSYRG00499 [Hibiscus syriacus]